MLRTAHSAGQQPAAPHQLHTPAAPSGHLHPGHNSDDSQLPRPQVSIRSDASLQAVGCSLHCASGLCTGLQSPSWQCCSTSTSSVLHSGLLQYHETPVLCQQMPPGFWDAVSPWAEPSAWEAGQEEVASAGQARDEDEVSMLSAHFSALATPSMGFSAVLPVRAGSIFDCARSTSWSWRHAGACTFPPSLHIRHAAAALLQACLSANPQCWWPYPSSKVCMSCHG